MNQNEKDSDAISYQHMSQLPLSHFEDITFISMPKKRDTSIIHEEENIQEEGGTIEIQKMLQFMNDSKSPSQDLMYRQKLEPIEDISETKIINNNELSLKEYEDQQNKEEMIILQPQMQQELEPFQQQEQNYFKVSFEVIEQDIQDTTQQIQKKQTMERKPIEKKLTLQKTANKIKVSMFLKIWKFYTNISANSRIFSKLTNQQHDIISDQASFFENLTTLKKNQFYSNPLIFQLQRAICFLLTKMPSLPIFMRSNFLLRIWDIIQALSILSTMFAISIIVFFQQDSEYFQTLFKITFFILLASVFINFNIADIKKGNIITQRKQISKNYLKTDFLFDFIGLLPILIEILQVEMNSIYAKYSIYIFILLLNVSLRNIVDRLTFYLSYEKNLKNTIDLVKLIFIIGLICHIFCLFWHGIAVIEIQYGQQNNWLHLTNLDQENSVVKRYIYSFYYLAVTMITVGYGDITPQNQYEMSFTILTMFVTGFYYAFSLNKIGSILDNINKKDKLYNEQMQIIHGYMRNENVSSNLRGKISSYLKYLYKESNEVQRNNEKQIVDKLSRQLKIDLIQEVSGKYISNIPFLNELKNKNKIIELMEECLFSPGERIFTQGELDDHSLYFIVKGEVQILLLNQNKNDKQSFIKVLQRGNFFGEYSFLTDYPRLNTAIANDFCRLYRIQKEKFMKSIREDEIDLESFCMTRDQVLHNNSYCNTSVKCYSCEKSNHHFAQCPKTHYIRSKQSIILQYNYPKPQLKRKYLQRKERKANSLTHQELYIQAAFLINKNLGYSEIYNELMNKQHSENAVVEFDENKYFQELQDLNEKEQIPSKESSNHYAINKSKLTMQRRSSKREQLNTDSNTGSLNRIEELSEEKINHSEKSIGSDQNENKNYATSMGQLDKGISKIRLISTTQNTIKEKERKTKTSIQQQSLKSDIIIDSNLHHEIQINDTNKLQNKRCSEKESSYQKKKSYISQKWNTDDLDKKQIHDQKLFQKSDLENTKKVNEQPNQKISVQYENPLPSSMSQGCIQIHKEQKKETNQYHLSLKIPKPQQKIKEEKIPSNLDSLSNPSSQLILSPVNIHQANNPIIPHSFQQYKEDPIQASSSYKNHKTTDQNAESSLASPINSAKSFFNIVKKHSIQRQFQAMKSSSSILKGLSSLQNTSNNFESLIDIMKKTQSDQNKASLTILPNSNSIYIIQPTSNYDPVSSLKNSDVIITSILAKLSRKENEQYQVIVNQDQPQDKHQPDTSIYDQSANQVNQKEGDQDVNKLIYSSQQIKTVRTIDSIQEFDIAKIFKKYFPKYNYDIVLKNIKKLQQQTIQKKKSLRRITQSSHNKQFDSSYIKLQLDLTSTRIKKKTLFSQYGQSNNNNSALKDIV